ncbi:MAG: hypothetical protein ACRECZ_05525, partial [Methylocella sp.]
LIAFKPARVGVPLRAATIDHGTVVFFTGVRQERHKDEDGETKRARRVAGRRSGKSGSKPGGGPQK